MAPLQRAGFPWRANFFRLTSESWGSFVAMKWWEFQLRNVQNHLISSQRLCVTEQHIFSRRRTIWQSGVWRRNVSMQVSIEIGRAAWCIILSHTHLLWRRNITSSFWFSHSQPSGVKLHFEKNVRFSFSFWLFQNWNSLNCRQTTWMPFSCKILPKG